MFSRIFGALMVVSALTSPTYVFADDIPAQSKISNVTVFPVGAQVTRETEVSVKAGEHTVVLKDLPLGALHDSIRVEGKSDGGLEIGSVDVKTIYITEKDDKSLNADERKKLEDEIESLRDEKARLEGKIRSLGIQQEFVQGLSQLPTRPLNESKEAEGTAEPDWQKLYTLIGKNMLSLQNERLETKIAIRKLNKQIRELTEKLDAKPPRQERRTQVQVAVYAEKDQNAVLKVRYQVNGAKWRPIYDARLKTDKDAAKANLSITRRASILQTTGEEWKDVALKLSTTRPNRDTAVPKLDPLLVALRPQVQPAPKVASRRRQYSQESIAESESDAKMAFARKPVRGYGLLKRKAAVVRYSQVTLSAFQAVYSVPGKVTISSTGERKKLTLSKLDIKPKLKAVAVPQKQKAAFLSAKFELPKGDLLIAGHVNLHRDGVYIGNGRLPELAAGAEHELGFGVDNAIQIKYAEIKRSKGESGIITSSKTDTRKFKISVKNLHGWDMPVTILDQVPYTENEEVKISRLSETTKPSRENVEEKRGLIAWDFDLKGGQEKTITLGYQVSWPKDRSVVYRRR